MLGIAQTKLPSLAFLTRYEKDGSHTDCFTCNIKSTVNLAEFITVFYTTPLFKLERLILKLVDKPSSDVEVRELARGLIDEFAAWTVEAREENQILLCDYQGKTRSWLMVSDGNGKKGTDLYFGSAVMAQKSNGQIGAGFKLLMGFHKLYSVLLLYSARKTLMHN